MEKNKNNFALIFTGLEVSDAEQFRVAKEIEKVGGLTFTITTSVEGWVAVCNQIDGLIAGNANTNPTTSEVESEIRQAIIAAFGVEVKKPEVKSPFKFEYKMASTPLV